MKPPSRGMCGADGRRRSFSRPPTDDGGRNLLIIPPSWGFWEPAKPKQNIPPPPSAPPFRRSRFCGEVVVLYRVGFRPVSPALRQVWTGDEAEEAGARAS